MCLKRRLTPVFNSVVANGSVPPGVAVALVGLVTTAVHTGRVRHTLITVVTFPSQLAPTLLGLGNVAVTLLSKVTLLSDHRT